MGLRKAFISCLPKQRERERGRGGRRRREALATTSSIVVCKKLGEDYEELEGRKEGKFIDWEEKGSYSFMGNTFFAGRWRGRRRRRRQF